MYIFSLVSGVVCQDITDTVLSSQQKQNTHVIIMKNW